LRRETIDTVARIRAYTVAITEHHESRSCHEGMNSNFIAVVRTTAGEFVDSIVGFGNGVGVFENREALKGDPLLSADEYPGGSAAGDWKYWNLRTGKPVFDAENLVSFVANGGPRYLSLSGGYLGDTVGILEDGDARSPTQRVIFRGDSLSGGSNFQVDKDSLVGPRGPNGSVVLRNCCSGPATDTVPVRGVTIRFRVGSREGAMSVSHDLSAEIVDDRLVTLPVKRVGSP
jgi:hypothetical protein